MDMPPSGPAMAPASDEVSRRLAALETIVADLARRVDTLAASSEAAVSAAVAREVQGIAGELRHTVSELGRLLVRDLGKLSKILAEHRDTIVSELKGDDVPPAAGEEAPATADEGSPDEAVPSSPDEDGDRSWLSRKRQS